ncbi:hypothetical protein JI739_14445 [Ramlibacter sp. AW1]|uniref:Uncharacterized protein n=1 Tax=Ramlibacter aurantiacus TaxID=2801330 RepID=A0A936ZHJ3_9BURK|nr:hypothetical protein [Ramlibacter aurantiacus]MBL0421554.1 hypothetical protein [Ramlibacter aurantiacus]
MRPNDECATDAGDPQVNGEVRQQVDSNLMIYNLWDQIAYQPTVMTLEPGGRIATSMPLALVAARQPPQFLNVCVGIANIGHIENPVVAETV